MSSAGLSKTSIPVLTGAQAARQRALNLLSLLGVLSVRPVRVLKPIPQQLEKAVPLLHATARTNDRRPRPCKTFEAGSIDFDAG